MNATLPREPRGRSTVWAGMAVLVIIEVTILLSMIASYFYLRTTNVFWPPPGVDAPEVLRPAAGHALVALSAAPMRAARRRFRAPAKGSVSGPLALGVAILAAASALLLASHPAAGLDWRRHAYGAIVMTISGYGLLHVVVVVLLAGSLSALELRGHLRARRAAAVDGVAVYWYFVAATSPLIFAILHLSPRLV